MSTPSVVSRSWLLDLLGFEWLIGLRYTRAKRRNGFISFISAASMIGIMLGIASLITVLSVMNGFQRDVRNRILDATPHIQVSGAENRLPDWQTVAQNMGAEQGVLATAPFVQGQGLLMGTNRSSGSTSSGAMQGVIVRGIDPPQEARVSGFFAHMVKGQFNELKPDSFGIILGRALATQLGVNVGDKVLMLVPNGIITPAGMVPRSRSFTVVGLFNLDMFLYDANLVLINMADAQKLYRLDQDVSGVQMKLQDPMRAPQLAATLEANQPDGLPDHLLFRDWTRENADYFRAVEIERRMMFVILTLIIAVASVNLVSSLVMTVTDKEADIAILRTQGAPPGSITSIFVIQGAVIGCVGTLLGVVFGSLLATNIAGVVRFFEKLFGFQVLSPQIYFISELPSEVRLSDVTSVAIISLILALLATIYPSWRASRLNPAESLRYE